MEIKLAPVKGKGTWYDYKLAVVSTLMKYDLYLRMKGSKRDVVTILRKDVRFNSPEAIVVAIPKKNVKWKDFYLNELSKILEKELGQ